MPSPLTDTVLSQWQDFENKCFKTGQKIPPAQYKLYKACFYAGVVSTISNTARFNRGSSEEECKKRNLEIFEEATKYILEIIGSMDGDGFLV